MVGSSVLIAVAPNGARRTKVDHPKLPISPKEIGECAKYCLEAGAGMIHLHVRDKNQQHSLSVDDYKDAIKQIRQQTDDGIFIQVTSEAVGMYTAKQQFQMIHTLKPPAVSIGIREIRELDEKIINQHFKQMRRNNVLPQLILYNGFDFEMYQGWLQRGVLVGSAYPLLYVIGKQQREGCFEVSDLEKLAKAKDSNWMICAFGEQEFTVAKLAAERGGHVRLGFENNCLLSNGKIAPSNADLVLQMTHYLKNEKKGTATSKYAQELMQPNW